jgi:acyl-CoA synthetase (AMP-forming)/AMP-acid ligase II
VAESIAMPSDVGPGVLLEPLNGRGCAPSALLPEVLHRMSFYRGQGVGPGDRVFIHYGNCLEFVADLLAIWDLGASAVPLDPTNPKGVVVDPASVEAVQEICRALTARLAPHQIPARWYAVSGIALTANGKIDRQETARRCAALTPLDTKKLK